MQANLTSVSEEIHQIAYRTSEELLNYCRSDGFLARFWNKVQKTDSCWIWIGATDPHNRGNIGVNVPGKRIILASVASWLIHYGKIPKGLCVCHNCPNGDNPSCVNPSHLWIGTQLQNVADMVRKGRSAKCQLHSQAKLTNSQVAEIRQMHASGAYKQLDIANKFHVTQSTISVIVNNVRWASTMTRNQPTH